MIEQKLEDFSLKVWDHRTHLRLAWLYLTRLGRRAGLQAIHTSIRAFIAHSPVARRRSGTTYHETMTYFWAHMVHFAIASTKLPAGGRCGPGGCRTYWRSCAVEMGELGAVGPSILEAKVLVVST